MILALNKDAILACITAGDWPGGAYYLVVCEDMARVVGYERNSLLKPWPAKAMVARIPALDPEGSGQASEDAWSMIKSLGKLAEAQEWAEEHDESLVEYCITMMNEDWAENRREGADFLAEEFLDALNDPKTEIFGFDRSGQPRQPTVRFEWR